MTKKKEKIISIALEMFAQNGFDATSTNKIATQAGVSEGLIFKHFQNKLGLLAAIMQLGSEKIEDFASVINKLATPEEKIQTILELPFYIEESEHPFWKLMYSLKWQNNYYDDDVINPLKSILIEAFKTLKYSHPEVEANLIIAYVDGFATTILLKTNSINKIELLKVVQKKYKWITK